MMNMLNMLHNDYSYRMIGNQKVKNIFFYIQKSSLYKNVSCLTHIILRKWTLNFSLDWTYFIINAAWLHYLSYK